MVRANQREEAFWVWLGYPVFSPWNFQREYYLRLDAALKVPSSEKISQPLTSHKVEFTHIFNAHKNLQKSRNYFNLLAIKQDSTHSNPSSTLGAINFQKLDISSLFWLTRLTVFVWLPPYNKLWIWQYTCKKVDTVTSPSTTHFLFIDTAEMYLKRTINPPLGLNMKWDDMKYWKHNFSSKCKYHYDYI